MWHDLFTCVTWPIHVCGMTHGRAQAARSANIVHRCVCGMTHLYIWHDSSICVTWVTHMWHDLFIGDVTRWVQHTATHCNTQEQTATYCNTLQHAAIRCNTLQHTATHWTHCNTLQHIVTHYQASCGPHIAHHAHSLSRRATSTSHDSFVRRKIMKLW